MPQATSSVIHRPFEDADFDAVVDICVRIWCTGVEGVYDRMIFGRVMTAGALRRSQIATVATKDDVVVGACFGGLSQGGSSTTNEVWSVRFDELMTIARKRAKIGGIEVEETLFSRLRMYTTADVFISFGYTNAESEVNLLVVDPRHMHEGIGTRLFEDMVLALCSEDAHGCLVVLREDYDLEFFEHRGLSCIQRKGGASGDTGDRVIYLYGRRL